MILDVAVWQQVVKLGLVVLFLVGLKLCVTGNRTCFERTPRDSSILGQTSRELLRGCGNDEGAGAGVVLADLLVLGVQPSQAVYLGGLGTGSSRLLYPWTKNLSSVA